jgi:adenylate cyclase
VGVGVNTGDIILGNIGSENRKEYAAIGDTVNVASRLCDLARRDMILVSETVMGSLDGQVKGRIIPDQAIKGKTSRISFYVVEAVREHKTSTWLK